MFSTPDPAVVFLCGGQGSQYFGMARSLYREDARFRDRIEELDAFCRRRYALDVTDYLYGPAHAFPEPCDDLPLSSAAIFMVQYALGEVLKADGIHPDLLVGSSLGEFVALAIAGHLPATDVLGFVVDMARATQRLVPAGGMLTVLGDPALYRALPALQRNTELASVNHAGHFVLTGLPAGLAAAQTELESRGLVTVALPVRYPFHGAALEPLRDTVERLVTPAVLRAGVPPVVSSATTAPITVLDGPACWRILREPIAFTDAISALPLDRPTRYLDLTPSGTLAAILKGSHPDRRAFPVITPFGNEQANLKRIREATA